MNKAKSLAVWLLRTIKFFPEFITIPVVFVSLFLAQGYLVTDPEANHIIPNDWIQFLFMASVTVMFGNAIAHGALKYNQPAIWKEYKDWVSGSPRFPRKYALFLSLYLLGFLLAMLALV